MKNWISFPRMAGTTSRQAHADMPEGSFERETGREGFFGPATHMYHTHAPTGWSSMEGPLRPRAYDTGKWDHDMGSPWKAKALVSNANCAVRFWSTDQTMDHLVSNSDGDELLFIHNGAGDLYCDFGHMAYRDGDYIVLPRGTQWRIEPSEKTDMMLVEATGSHYQLPDKGMMGPHAIFDPAMLDVPELNDKFEAQKSEDETCVTVKRQGEFTKITYPFNPLDAMGWKGDNLPVRMNWRDIRPLVSHRYHVPPSAHITFVAVGFVICTFAPRPIESDPGALKVPFYHNNDDYDEFIFYHRGEFFSRDNIHPGMTTFHPIGFTHGPHPKAFEAGKTHTRKATDEVAVMIDTRDPVNIVDGAGDIEWTDYVHSWKTQD